MSRTKDSTANVAQIKDLLDASYGQLDIKSIIGLTMKACGVTYRQIGEVFDFTPQAAETMLKTAQKSIK